MYPHRYELTFSAHTAVPFVCMHTDMCLPLVHIQQYPLVYPHRYVFTFSAHTAVPLLCIHADMGTPSIVYQALVNVDVDI